MTRDLLQKKTVTRLREKKVTRLREVEAWTLPCYVDRVGDEQCDCPEQSPRQAHLLLQPSSQNEDHAEQKGSRSVVTVAHSSQYGRAGNRFLLRRRLWPTKAVTSWDGSA